MKQRTWFTKGWNRPQILPYFQSYVAGYILLFLQWVKIICSCCKKIIINVCILVLIKCIQIYPFLQKMAILGWFRHFSLRFECGGIAYQSSNFNHRFCFKQQMHCVNFRTGKRCRHIQKFKKCSIFVCFLRTTERNSLIDLVFWLPWQPISFYNFFGGIFFYATSNSTCIPNFIKFEGLWYLSCFGCHGNN